MKRHQAGHFLLISICALLLAGCASSPAPAPDAGAPAVAAAPVKCRMTEAGTGTSIVRKDCSGNPDVISSDPREFMDSKRSAMPGKN